MTSDTVYTLLASPFGPVRVAWRTEGLVSVAVGDQVEACSPDPTWRFEAGFVCPATVQLGQYFEGRRRRFDIPLVLHGTSFQLAVWRALADIPFASTISYAEFAAVVGRPKAIRAVGAANARNPVPIVLPCHRVIGTDGDLRGYAGGVSTKAALLAFERNRRESEAPLQGALRL